MTETADDAASPGGASGPAAPEALDERPRLLRPPARIVSLVPSLTEALFDLGLGARVVGVTRWCVHPAAGVTGLPKVGGTKDTDVAAVLALAPDLVLANREENTKRTVDALRAAGIPVWVTYPRTVAEAATLLRELAGMGANDHVISTVVEPVERAVSEATRTLPARPTRVFCPIWRDPWMSVGPDTYAHTLLALCGGANVFAECRERRYPILTLDAVVAAAPDVILLPDEPYAFGPRDAAELRELPIPAAETGRIHCIDGTWVSWYGPRVRVALSAIRRLLHPHAGSG